MANLKKLSLFLDKNPKETAEIIKELKKIIGKNYHRNYKRTSKRLNLSLEKNIFKKLEQIAKSQNIKKTTYAKNILICELEREKITDIKTAEFLQSAIIEIRKEPLN
jgi:predicted DNA-binding ribbon-helix-helix protein